MTWRRWAEAGSTALLFVLTWPVPALAPSAGLDPSWQAGLHLAAHRGLAFGHDITFTYGPLGFLGAPRLFFTTTAVLSFLYVAAVHAVLCFTVVHLGRRLVPLPVAVVAGFLLVAFALTEPAEIVPVLVAVWCVRAVGHGRRAAGDLAWWPWLVGAAVAVVQLYVKFNAGVVCIALLVLAAAFVFPRGWRLPAVLAAELGALGLGLWVAAGGSPSDLASFVGQSVQMTSGYSAAMALEQAGRTGEYLAAALLSVATIGAIVFAARRYPGLRAVPIVAVVVAFGYVEFRRGFVRHDAHSVPFFLTGALLPLGVRWPRPATAAAVILVVAWTAVLGSSTESTLETMIDPVPRVEALRDQTRTLVDAARRERTLLAGKSGVREAVDFGPATVAELDGHTVHVDPVETSAVWAYGLEWRPEPVFQSYLAYTPVLDRQNADLLASARGPQRVLRHAPLEAIDGRQPLMDDPRSELALACNYYQVFIEGHWQVLRKGPDRCLPPRRLGRSSVGSGQEIPVPAVGSDELLVVHLRLQRSLPARVVAALFKPPAFDYIVLDGVRARLVAANAGGPLLLCLPPTIGYSPPISAPCPKTLGVVHDGPISVEFAAVPLRPQQP